MKRFLAICCLCALTLSWPGVLRGEDAAVKDREKTITVFPIVLNSGRLCPVCPPRCRSVLPRWLEWYWNGTG